MSQTDVHQIAADFLKEIQGGNSPFYCEEKIEVAALEMSTLVVLRKVEHPQYFYGFKLSGYPVFTHDVKLARTFESTCEALSQHSDKLKQIGFEVEPEPTIWREGILA